MSLNFVILITYILTQSREVEGPKHLLRGKGNRKVIVERLQETEKSNLSVFRLEKINNLDRK